MVTVGGAISGYSETGRRNCAMTPMIRMISDRTEAKIGRSMKKWEKRMRKDPDERGLLRAGRDLARLRVDLGGRPHHRVGEAVEHDAIVGLQALAHDAQAFVEWSQGHRAALDDIVLVDHEHDLARLVRHDGGVRDQQRIVLAAIEL